MRKDLNDLKKSTQKLINKLDEKDIMGPVAFLEESLENIDQAIEEYDLFFADNNEDQD